MSDLFGSRVAILTVYDDRESRVCSVRHSGKCRLMEGNVQGCTCLLALCQQNAMNTFYELLARTIRRAESAVSCVAVSAA